MAKKKEVVKQNLKKISPNITCKCGKEWNRKTVETDTTYHTMDSYRYKFLRTFASNSQGFEILNKLNACPTCREEVHKI